MSGQTLTLALAGFFGVLGLIGSVGLFRVIGSLSDKLKASEREILARDQALEPLRERFNAELDRRTHALAHDVYRLTLNAKLWKGLAKIYRRRYEALLALQTAPKAPLAEPEPTPEEVERRRDLKEAEGVVREFIPAQHEAERRAAMLWFARGLKDGREIDDLVAEFRQGDLAVLDPRAQE